MESVGKKIAVQGVKAGLFSLVFSCVGVLLLALFAKLFGLSDGILPIINQVFKALSVVIATALSVKEEKFLLKAVIGAIVYWLLSVALFAVLGGGFNWAQIGLDLAIALVCAVLVAVFKSKRS